MILDMIPPYYQPSKGVQNIFASLSKFSSVCLRRGEKFQTFRPWGASTSVGLVGILIIGNSDGVRTSSKSMCACGVLSRPRGKNLVKFGTSFYDCSFQTGASHMKDHGFPKGDVSIQTPMAGDFIVWPHKNFPMIRNHQYTTCLIFWHIWGIISYI